MTGSLTDFKLLSAGRSLNVDIYLPYGLAQVLSILISTCKQIRTHFWQTRGMTEVSREVSKHEGLGQQSALREVHVCR